jgi:hypothetical protein
VGSLHSPWSRFAVFAFAAVLLSGCGGPRTPNLAASGPSSSGSKSTATSCDLLTKMSTEESLVNNADLASIHDHLPKLVALADRLVRQAPSTLRADATVMADQVHEALKLMSVPGFDPAHEGFPQTPKSLTSADLIRSWADSNCKAPIDRNANKANELVVCLAAGSGSDAVQLLLARTSTPSPTGNGDDLLPGIAGVSAGEDAISVNLDPFITPDQEAHLKEVLGSAPVVAIRESVANGNVESPSHDDCR